MEKAETEFRFSIKGLLKMPWYWGNTCIRFHAPKRKVFHTIFVARRELTETIVSLWTHDTYWLKSLILEGREECWAWLALLKMAELICPGSFTFVGVHKMLRGLTGLVWSRRNQCMCLGWGLGRRGWLDVRRWGCLVLDIFLWFSWIPCDAAQWVSNLEVRIPKCLEWQMGH